MSVLRTDWTVCVCVHSCRPTSLDAFVFGFVAPLYKAGLPSSPLQRHLKQLNNLTRFCDNILAVYFGSHGPCKSAAPTTGNTPTFSCTHLDNVTGGFPLLLSVSPHACSLDLHANHLLFSPLLFWAPGSPQPVQETKDANLQKLTQLVNKESNLIEKVPLLSS